MFDKPKVILDLDEYLELKKNAEKNNSDKTLVAAKKIIAAILYYGSISSNSAIQFLKSQKISLSTSGGPSSSLRSDVISVYENLKIDTE